MWFVEKPAKKEQPADQVVAQEEESKTEAMEEDDANVSEF